MLPILMFSLNIGIMTHNMGGVESLLVCFFTVCRGDLLTLLDVLGVYNCLAEMLGDLVSLGFWDFVALLVILIVTFRPSRMSVMSVMSVSSMTSISGLTFVMVTPMMMSFMELLNIMTDHMR